MEFDARRARNQYVPAEVRCETLISRLTETKLPANYYLGN